MGIAIIDVEIASKVQLHDALAFLRATLQRLRVPRTTLIKRYVPEETTYSVYCQCELGSATTRDIRRPLSRLRNSDAPVNLANAAGLYRLMP